MARPRIDLREVRSGSLRAIEPTPLRKGNNAYWRCACRCGRFAIVRSDHLIEGRVKSCGKCRTRVPWQWWAA